jgi:polyribonucleotide nucleotidyltransferase
MFKETTKELEWNDKILKLSTGKIAKQADGSVMVSMGDSVVLCTVVSAKEAKPDIGFFPLTVHYREMSFAAGKIPGGFLKREGKGTDREALVSRLIDRPIRPLFHQGFFNETQIICTVLSYDKECPTDILSMIGASAALSISGAPYLDISAASRVAFIDGKYILNPSTAALKNSQLDLVVAGTSESVMMVESEAKFLSETQMLEAVRFGHESFQPVIQMIKDFAASVGAKSFWSYQEAFTQTLKEKIKIEYTESIVKAFGVKEKQARSESFKKISERLVSEITIEYPDQFSISQINSLLEEIKADILRKDLLENNIRIDGRKSSDIRNITCEIGLLPKTHGSSLFTRGETQSLVVTTLGTGQDEQIVDALEGEYKEHFMLNYIFPPYSVGESTPLKAPSRREVGHAKLAWRAINPALPSKEVFPYSIRVVSEITESNGSSSMATVCGTSMSLMDAGVPLKTPISGIAMGLVKEGDKFVVLSDIIADEDYLGDMDFKVAGSSEGITALQMDIKVCGVTFEIMEQALNQAKAGRLHILDKMSEAISESKSQVSKFAPSVHTMKIDKDRIREIIGPGGKVIREICETTGAKIDISDDGTISVSAVGQEKIEAAVARIAEIVFEPEVGDMFDGTVVRVLDSGAFVNYSGNKDGFVHISEISHQRIKSVSDVLSQGGTVKVKILGFDNRGKAKLTIKNAETVVQDQSVSSNEIKESTQEEPRRNNSSSKPSRKDPKIEHSNRNRTRPDSVDKTVSPSGNEEVKPIISERKYFS